MTYTSRYKITTLISHKKETPNVMRVYKEKSSLFRKDWLSNGDRLPNLLQVPEEGHTPGPEDQHINSPHGRVRGHVLGNKRKQEDQGGRKLE